ncbi:motility associated factor glycosyltransferase family protein [Arcobacter arenosus]|uniref:Motility associated factor glycosyltransferase family protein n=1 Tax=Arcobacter arenosus TaxID=2576037 RepID=A0A5R8Y1S5_9BACT|nr:6-hydroxymethylpterin diphosphokinase MptE-like protein [Arcobacter arenosus]TLP38512.1 motility associated factor glycosyltransferase family protein [Arcobacter arenosus]
MDLEKNYQNNMTFLKEGWPEVYNSIIKADIKDYELNITQLGEYNIAIKGKNIYPGKVDLAIQAQVNAFLDNPPMFFKKPTWNKDSDKDYYHDKLIKGIELKSEYLKENKGFENYHQNLEGYFPFLLMMGIGSGAHIQKLIQQSNGIKEIIIVDESYEMLKVSFHLLDWRPIFMYFKQKNHGLHFCIGSNSQEISRIVLNTIYKNFSYQFYLIPFYTHYKSKFFDEFKEKFIEKIDIAFTGQGFYDDEIISLEHTIKNLNDDLPVYRYSNKLPKNSTAFIVASGPSIDKDIEYIKKHKDNVVLISCGTALRVLYKNGISPDFHMEIERPTFMASIIENYGTKEYLKNIDMIGLNVIDPKVYSMFKSAKIYFRDNDAGSSIVPEDIPKLNHCNPTIVNGALSFLSDIGFQNIFMFGTDMGFKDPESHHSKDTIYYNTKEHKVNTLDLLKEKFPGNFDKEEKFMTTNIFNWCKQRAENCILDYKVKRKIKINYFNCSDGLYIDGTTPFKAESIKLDNKINKVDILKGIENNFDFDFEKLHKEIDSIYKSEKEMLISNIKEIKEIVTQKEIETFKELFDLISTTYEIANNPNYENKSYLTRSLLKGTMYHFYTALYTHALATSDKNKAMNFVNSSLLKLLEFFEEVENRVKDINLK